MFHFAFSARIQYSRRAPPARARTAWEAAPVVPLASAAATFGGTGISSESFPRSASPRSAKIFWPAIVHRKSPPVPANNSLRPKGSRSTDGPELLLDLHVDLHHGLVVSADEVIRAG